MEQTRTGTRLATLAVAALALCLFAAAASASRSESGPALLARRAAMLELLHHQAEIALVTAAQDRSFEAYFRATSDAERAALKEHLDLLTANMQTTFAVDGVCLIDLEGTEIASTSGEEAGDTDGENGTEVAFFHDAFLQPARHVHLSPIFVSSDTHRWVVSYATPILVDSAPRAILHYEHNLDDYQRLVTERPDGVAGFLLLVDEGGWIIADSRKPVDMRQHGDSVDPAGYFAKFEWDGMSLDDLEVRLGREGGVMDHTVPGPDGPYRVGYQVVRGWTLLLFEKL
jgi:hypothetical protein